MKLTPEDPRLSAWLLGELPAAEAAAVERAVAADPALRLSVEELRRVVRRLEGALATPATGLRPSQREAVLKASRHADAAGKLVEFESAKRGLRPWLATAGAAAAVVLALGVASKVGAPRKPLAGSAGETSEIALLPLPGPQASGGSATAAAGATDTAEAARAGELEKAPARFLENVARELGKNPLPDPSRLPAVKPLPPLQSASGDIALPVLVGRASFGWTRGWIRERAALPPAEAVRLEELVNEFPLPVTESADRVAHEIMTAPCAWNSRAVLVAATLRAPAGREAEVVWSFEPAPGTRSRVIASPGSGTARLPDRLPAGHSATVLLEIEPVDGSERLGVLKIDADGQFSGHILSRPDGAAAAPVRRLELVAAFGLWLRQEGVDRAVLERLLAREPDGDLARLVRQALDIAAAGR
jgi:hypothetical protein